MLFTMLFLLLRSRGIVSEWLGFLLLFGITMVFSRFMRKKNMLWQDYELTIGPDFIEQKGPMNHVARIRKGQIAGISEHRDYVLVVSRSGHAMVSIPRQLQGFDEVVGELRMWHGPADSSALRAYRLLMVGPYFLLAAVHFGARYLPPLAAAIANLVGVGILLWHAYILHKHAGESDQAWQRFVPWANIFIAVMLLIEALQHLAKLD